MSKITSQTLAEKIVKAVQDMTAEVGCELTPLLSEETILERVPELKNYDKLADQIETCYQDAQMALTGDWDRSDEGFEATRDACATVYRDAVGVEPEEPEVQSDDDEEEGEEEEEEPVETAPDESER